MSNRLLLAVLVLCVVSLATSVSADTRYFQRNGVTWEETRRTVQQPVRVTRMEDRQQTVYREQVTTEMQETTRTHYQPVTEYRWMACLRGRWNPFVQPYYTYQLKPTRRWEPRQEIVRYPSQRRELVPEVRTVQVPVTTTQLAEREYITRVPVAGNSAASVASRGASNTAGVGGVARLESDPPRQSTAWRPATQKVIK